MKLFFSTAVAISFSALSISASDQQSTITLPSNSEEGTAVTVTAPFKNHWDSNSWEAGSDQNFWNASTEETAENTTAQESVATK